MEDVQIMGKCMETAAMFTMSTTIRLPVIVKMSPQRSDLSVL